jgi:cephalosporin-C deacetylase-like acetyl esterase
MSSPLNDAPRIEWVPVDYDGVLNGDIEGTLLLPNGTTVASAIITFWVDYDDDDERGMYHWAVTSPAPLPQARGGNLHAADPKRVATEALLKALSGHQLPAYPRANP